MNRENVQSLLVIVAIVVAAAIVWYVGNVAFASGLVGLLAGRLIDLLVVGKKDSAQLAYRASLLTKPLQDIFATFSEPRLEYACPAVMGIFQREIVNRGLVKVLKADAPGLADTFAKMKSVIDDTRNQPISEDMVREAMGELYKPNLNVVQSVKESYVITERLREKSELKELVNKMKEQIEGLLAKYGGA